MVDKARLKNHVRRKDLMCRRRHKTAYGRRQLQIGQQTALYLYKMHESTEDPRSTPWLPVLVSLFGQSSRGSDEGLRRSISGSNLITFWMWAGVRVWAGQNRGCLFTSKGTRDADWSVQSCTEQTLAMTGWRVGGDDLLKAFVLHQWNYYQYMKTRLASG